MSLQETGWICPVCEAGVAPSVKEHCKKAKKSIPFDPQPVTPYPRPTNYCNLCHQTYYGWGHSCIRWVPDTILPVKDYPYRVTCNATGQTTASSGPLPKDDNSDLSVFSILRDIENLWPSCTHDRNRGENCDNCPPDSGQPAYGKVPQKTM